MYVARIGFTPVKGGRHRTHGSALLTEAGPLGDRAFCLVDATVDRCLRTVENPTLLQASAGWDGRVLTVELPAGTATGEPQPTGEVREVDYWGRTAVLEVVDGPWAAAYSEHLGREVVLARSAPGDVVYGGAVTLVTTGSLARLADEVGESVDGSRFRATLEVDADAGVEDDWLGRRLRVGAAEVRVRGLVPRCAVIDLDPATGVRDRSLLAVLAASRRVGVEIPFGVDAEVTVPGWVATGDRVELVPE